MAIVWQSEKMAIVWQKKKKKNMIIQYKSILY